MTNSTIRTAIFPVAGLGTRFLPATKATPKELLPVIDTPLIQYAIDEARDAGVERMIFVSHPSKEAIERHVRQDAELSATLKERGKVKIADKLDDAALDEDEHEIVFVMQDEPLGLGHAVNCARDHVLPGAVAVILPDDLIMGETGCLSEMAEAYAKTDAGHMVATMDVPREKVSSYGVLAPTRTEGPLTFARGMVEKPDPADAPSTKAVVGRYILDACIFDALAVQGPGSGGEIQLTDAIAAGIEKVGLVGFEFSGERFDCGSKQGMLAATLTLAARDKDYAEVLSEFCDKLDLRPAA
ncbi:UTP--glucose-1-phosphate uridylyltransferase [Tranquillimonas alkanivorans]|uniref:UTP--glucose-1-phosphate uridylyltransferase n=1 Tax=Tranquillimonas alkanivorans TaxID=441119 RepID=A0A1I5KG96_9RHOB|nr:UTP--glucose-1-phosphate uridylyltransferase [Tranquillimonas alkanivorans]SFO84007.1 UTP--glucose-1-phosphate uridylyltransferase [Tranquillimonas alkanivorans]